MKVERPSISTLISIGALCVSCAAFWNTIVTQGDDREFRELSIRPVLAHLPEATDFSLRIKNRGLGPAVIKRMGGIAEGKCMELDSKSHWATAAAFQSEHLFPFFLTRLGLALAEVGVRFDGDIRTRGHMP